MPLEHDPVKAAANHPDLGSSRDTPRAKDL
jgi:hypothetical protein